MPLATSVARTMVELGVINDSSFAKARATRLSHSGQSRRAIEARLAAKGIATSTVSNVLNVTLGSDERARESELGAALVFARKRRAGPFSVASPDESADRQKNEQRLLMAFARAGFARDIAMQALTTDREEAEDRIIALKDAL
ncbi:recombinase A [Acetobacter oeni LMG 21952]|nr:recombinase A [Acetobacter oeni LMG 21952]